MHVCAHADTECPLAEELGLEHSRLCSAAGREGGREGEGKDCDCSFGARRGVEERGLAG